MIEATQKQLARRYGLKTVEADIPWERRVLPHTLAPVILNEKGVREMRVMEFALIPSWSKERRVKFATHNARLMSSDDHGNPVPIYDKATWKGPFRRRRCLVPLTGFIEPIYEGQLAGNMVEFFERSHEILSAAGIWDTWTSKTDGEIIESFAVLTDDPLPFVGKMGHDRTPVFLEAGAEEFWLDPEEHDPKRLLDFLRTHKADLELEAKTDRALKPGWEKRR